MGIIYFLVYLFLEILFSYEFARIFTPVGLFLEVLITAVAGVYIIQNLHLSLFENMQKVMRREITQEEFVSIGIFKLIGAFLLIIPGVFSDIVGLLFLFEPFARWIAKKFLPSSQMHYHHTSSDDEDIIDVEIVEIIEDKTK
jgi:UPF0716 family protein affecting phage T7 exclusion